MRIREEYTVRSYVATRNSNILSGSSRAPDGEPSAAGLTTASGGVENFSHVRTGPEQLRNFFLQIRPLWICVRHGSALSASVSFILLLRKRKNNPAPNLFSWSSTAGARGASKKPVSPAGAQLDPGADVFGNRTNALRYKH